MKLNKQGIPKTWKRAGKNKKVFYEKDISFSVECIYHI
jgi:hypothetical protein